MAKRDGSCQVLRQCAEGLFSAVCLESSMVRTEGVEESECQTLCSGAPKGSPLQCALTIAWQREMDHVKPYVVDVQNGCLLRRTLKAAWPRDMDHVKSYISSM